MDMNDHSYPWAINGPFRPAPLRTSRSCILSLQWGPFSWKNWDADLLAQLNAILARYHSTDTSVNQKTITEKRKDRRKLSSTSVTLSTLTVRRRGGEGEMIAWKLILAHSMCNNNYYSLGCRTPSISFVFKRELRSCSSSGVRANWRRFIIGFLYPHIWSFQVSDFRGWFLVVSKKNTVCRGKVCIYPFTVSRFNSKSQSTVQK